MSGDKVPSRVVSGVARGLCRCKLGHFVPKLVPIFIGFGGIHGPNPYEFIGFGGIHGPNPYEFIGFVLIWASLKPTHHPT